MLYRIVLKNFKPCLKKYLLYFLGIAFSIAILMCFSWMRYFIKEIKIANPQYDFSGITFTIKNYYYMVVIISIIFLSYIIKQYTQLRISDYAVLLILGIRRKRMSMIITFEYLCIWLTTALGGLILGGTLIKGMVWFLKRKEISSIESAMHVGRTIGTTVAWSFLIFLVVFIYQLSLMNRKSVYGLEKEIKRQSYVSSKPWKKWLAFLGVTFIISGIVLILPQVRTNRTLFPAIFLCMGGIYLLLTFGLTVLLQYIKKKPDFYYLNILKLNEIYSKFTKNKNMLFLTFAVNFIIIYIVGLFTLDNMSVNYALNYPCNYVVQNISTQEAETLSSQNGVKKFSKLSYIPTTACGMGEDPELFGRDFIGISQMDYYKMTGNSVSMQKNEAFVVSQRWEEDRYMKLLPKQADTYVGEEKLELRYLEQQTKIIFWGMGKDTDLIVLADELFLTLSEKHTVLNMALMNISDEYYRQIQQVLQQITQNSGDVKVYDKKLQMQIKETESTFTIFVNTAVGLTMMLSCIFMLSIKLFSDMLEQKEKYRFLDCMGMRRKQQKKIIHSIITLHIAFPLLLAILFAGCFYLLGLIPDGFNMQNILAILAYMAVCIIPELIYLQVVKGVMTREVLARR